MRNKGQRRYALQKPLFRCSKLFCLHVGLEDLLFFWHWCVFSKSDWHFSDRSNTPWMQHFCKFAISLKVMNVSVELTLKGEQKPQFQRKTTMFQTLWPFWYILSLNHCMSTCVCCSICQEQNQAQPVLWLFSSSCWFILAAQMIHKGHIQQLPGSDPTDLMILWSIAFLQPDFKWSLCLSRNEALKKSTF